jgi:hypothetical protein
MSDRRTLREVPRAELLQVGRAHAKLAMLTALAALVVFLALSAPRPLWVPVIALGLLAVAALTAGLASARRTPWRGDRVTLWDISGAFAFIGCAAAMLSKPENVLQLIGPAMVP